MLLKPDQIDWTDIQQRLNNDKKSIDIIRKYKIDELPQLFCVFKGTMSLIGPRPERPEIESQFLKNMDFSIKDTNQLRIVKFS